MSKIKYLQNRPRVQLHTPGNGRTKQAFKDECDINKIMKKYVKTGIIEHAKTYQPEYGYATSDDFQQAMQTITKGQQMFDALPSQVRANFHNRPEQFLEFVQNPENEQSIFDMGLSDTPPYQPEKQLEETHISESNDEPVQ